MRGGRTRCRCARGAVLRLEWDAVPIQSDTVCGSHADGPWPLSLVSCWQVGGHCRSSALSSPSRRTGDRRQPGTVGKFSLRLGIGRQNWCRATRDLGAGRGDPTIPILVRCCSLSPSIIPAARKDSAWREAAGGRSRDGCRTCRRAKSWARGNTGADRSWPELARLIGARRAARTPSCLNRVTDKARQARRLH